jgi:hypothetical protein
VPFAVAANTSIAGENAQKPLIQRLLGALVDLRGLGDAIGDAIKESLNPEVDFIEQILDPVIESAGDDVIKQNALLAHWLIKPVALEDDQRTRLTMLVVTCWGTFKDLDLDEADKADVDQPPDGVGGSFTVWMRRPAISAVPRITLLATVEVARDGGRKAYIVEKHFDYRDARWAQASSKVRSVIEGEPRR